MHIFNILFHNAGHKIRTLPPTEQTLPDGFRGTLEHDTSLCIGCRTCAYVCSPGAITLDYQQEGIAWQYQPGRCTYCGRCAEYCPTGAIQLTAYSPSAGLPGASSPSEPAIQPATTQHLVAYQHCARCGRSFSALPVPVLEKLVGHSLSAGEKKTFDTAGLMRLCEKCRSRATSQQLKDSLIGKQKDNPR